MLERGEKGLLDDGGNGRRGRKEKRKRRKMKRIRGPEGIPIDEEGTSLTKTMRKRTTKS